MNAARVEWRGSNVPHSVVFNEPYYSLDGGLAESRHVFLRGNRLPERFRPGFRIAEIGIGTGLNMLTALDSWIASGVAGPLTYMGFESGLLSAGDMRKALAAFPDIYRLAEPLLKAWSSGQTGFETDAISAVFQFGDARCTVPAWKGRADAWFLDGFSPARNPQLWETDLLRSVAAQTAAGGSFATFTSAGRVRRDLASAGFAVRREPGFGRKRHMLSGSLVPP